MSKEKRTCRIYIRVTESESKQIKEGAENLKKGVTSYLRDLGLSGKVPKFKKTDSPEAFGFKQAKLADLGRIGNNLNQITRYVNYKKEDANTLKILIELQKINSQLRRWRDAD